MISSVDSNSGITLPFDQKGRKALGLEFALEGNHGSYIPEKTETEIAAEQTSPIKSSRELTDEEKARVEFLQNQLAGLLQDFIETPSNEKRASIRGIEAELEKITGVKTKTKLSGMTAKLPKEKEEKEEAEQDQQMRGMHPDMLKEAIAAQTLPEGGSGPAPDAPGPGVMSQMMKAAGAYHSVSMAALIPTSGTLLGKV